MWGTGAPQWCSVHYYPYCLCATPAAAPLGSSQTFTAPRREQHGLLPRAAFSTPLPLAPKIHLSLRFLPRAMQSPSKAVSKDLQRAPKPVVDKERALKFWEDSESERPSGNASFYKALRNNRIAIIVAVVAVVLVYFRLQEATYVVPSRLLHQAAPPLPFREFSLFDKVQRRPPPEERLQSGG